MDECKDDGVYNAAAAQGTTEAAAEAASDVSDILTRERRLFNLSQRDLKRGEKFCNEICNRELIKIWFSIFPRSSRTIKKVEREWV